jgi:hypothetical protein
VRRAHSQTLPCGIPFAIEIYKYAKQSVQSSKNLILIFRGLPI